MNHKSAVDFDACGKPTMVASERNPRVFPAKPPQKRSHSFNQSGRNLGLRLVDPETARLTRFSDPIGNSHPGLVEYDGRLRMSAGTAKVDAVVIGSIDLSE